MGTKVEKKYDVNKEVSRCGIYRSLCFKMDGKEVKYNYDLKKYCEVLEEVANEGNAQNKQDFQSNLVCDVFDINIVANKLSDEELDNQKANNCKMIRRLHNRILEGKESDGNTVASDRVCYDYLKQVEKRKKIRILTPIKDDKPFYYENHYLYSLVKQLIEIMYTSDMFNYIPDSSNYQHSCYLNHLKMIEDNVKEIFGYESEGYLKWTEILSPFQEIIREGNYPGIKSGSIWHSKYKELRFFDCAFEIAKNYELYCKSRNMLGIDLGGTKTDVTIELKNYNAFFNSKDQKDEKLLFCNSMLSALKLIVRDEFNLEV